MLKKLILLAAGLLLTGITAFQLVFNSVETINKSKRKAEWVDGGLSAEANDFFWEQFHQGNYDSIPAVLERLSAAYLANPNDVKTVTHLGFTNMWALTERQHLETVPGRIIDHATLAVKYFGESYRLNPRDTRILAFLASAKIIVGALGQDDKLIREGYFNGLKTMRDWYGFGAFSLAYTMSRLPHTDPNFSKTLQWMQETADRCYCEAFDPKSEACIAAVARRVEAPKSLGKNRITPNTWVAPHNIEGFFMSWGDLLVKSGDWQKAIDIYEFAKHAPDYENWDYREVLESRIKNARQNVELFRVVRKEGESIAVDQAVMVQTAIACRACHQMSSKDLALTYNGFDHKRYLDRSFYFLE